MLGEDELDQGLSEGGGLERLGQREVGVILALHRLTRNRPRCERWARAHLANQPLAGAWVDRARYRQRSDLSQQLRAGALCTPELGEAGNRRRRPDESAGVPLPFSLSIARFGPPEDQNGRWKNSIVVDCAPSASGSS